MLICAATIVRNEADIIEAFVRHNLARVDRLTVVDHGSFDGTSDILARLKQEGLPLTVLREERVGFFQPEVLTPVVRGLLAERAADFVFVLDADEFIRVESRAKLEGVLARVPEGMHALAPWVTYIPDFARAAGDPLTLLGSAKRLPAERQVQYKVIVGRPFLATPAAFVAMGNHRVYASQVTPDAPCPHARLPQELVALAHVPVRSAEQLTAKIAIGWLSHLAVRRGNPLLSFHWGEAYALLASGRRFSVDDLVAMAANYSIARKDWLPADPATWVEDPFLAAIALRYTELARCDAFASVLKLAERLANG